MIQTSIRSSARASVLTSLLLSSLVAVTGCGNKGPLKLDATLETNDREATFSFKTEPNTKIVCLDCTDLKETTSDGAGAAKVTLPIAELGDGHCFRAGSGPERSSEKACASPKLVAKVDVAANGNFTCSGGVECAGSVGPGTISFTKVSPGTKFEFQGKTTELKGGERFDLDLAKVFADASVDAIMKDAPLADVPGVIAAGASRLELHAKVSGANVRWMLFDRLKKVKEGPVVLPGAKLDAAPAKVRAIAYVGDDNEIYGAATKFEEIDLVAVQEKVWKKLGTCEYKSAGGATASAERGSTDYTIDVYDRHSGKKVQSKTFAAPPPPACNASVELGAGDKNAGYYGAVGDLKAAKAWVQSLVK